MENNLENNRITEDISDSEEYRFSYNFINEPWDNRSEKSKIAIISLLCATFMAIMALVTNNLVLHYRGFHPGSLYRNVEIDCNLIKVDDYPYVARIHSVASNEIICVGAVISATSVLANALCVKSGPIRIKLGSPIVPHCKKGFGVEAVEDLFNEGVNTKSIVILSTFENLMGCIETIKIGRKFDRKTQFVIIGRPFRRGKTLSLQFAYFETGNVTLQNIYQTICVQTIGRCPVRIGDLLLQKDQLIGLASMSVDRKDKTKTACFTKIGILYREIKNIDSAVAFIPTR